MAACATVDIGGPRVSKRNPAAGILQLEDGKRIGVLPAELNYTGQGAYTWPDGRTQTGSWRNGRLHGIGSETTTGASYTGQWHEGKRHGHGELEHVNGVRYVGDFADGLAHGEGTQTSKVGVYRGLWERGQRHGSGQLNAADGAVYQGQWEADQRAGYGRQTFANGGVYEGDWLADEPSGFGLFHYPNTAVYEGHWQAGNRHGYGVLTSAAEVRYEGTWRANEKDGFGRETRPDGSFFAGAWRTGRRHGEGREVHADGSEHAGLWQDDKIAGPGRRTTRAGIVIAGEWTENLIAAGSLELPGGATYQGALFTLQGRGLAEGLQQWLTTQAAADDAHAQYFLGSSYLDFEQPAPDHSTAQVWLQRAARAGVAEAQFRLSTLLLENDAGNALRWLERAAAQRHPEANELLGEYFHTGRHLPQNLAAAISHYENAAAKGSVIATNNLAWLLATAADRSVADPGRAVDLIRPLVLYLGHWQHLDTLAAAHARLGDTGLAERMQRQALIQAQSIASEEVLAQMSARLALYTNDQAYLEGSNR